jgi:hypothetical protein
LTPSPVVRLAVLLPLSQRKPNIFFHGFKDRPGDPVFYSFAIRIGVGAAAAARGPLAWGSTHYRAGVLGERWRAGYRDHDDDRGAALATALAARKHQRERKRHESK